MCKVTKNNAKEPNNYIYNLLHNIKNNVVSLHTLLIIM